MNSSCSSKTRIGSNWKSPNSVNAENKWQFDLQNCMKVISSCTKLNCIDTQKNIYVKHGGILAVRTVYVL